MSEKLWRSVIYLSILDATKTPTSDIAEQERTEARSWIEKVSVCTTTEDFESVCYMAGFSPEAVRDMARSHIDNPNFIRKRLNTLLREVFQDE
jgi:hypothetical protein